MPEVQQRLEQRGGFLSPSFERLDYLGFQLQEIDQLDLKAGDEDAWRERLKILAAAETIRARADSLVEDLYGRDDSAYGLLARSLPAAEYLKEMFPDFAPLKEEIDRFYGAYEDAAKEGHREGRITPAITWGYSKDHRPDLKQLLFILTTSADGGVPVQFRCANGNTNDCADGGAPANGLTDTAAAGRDGHADRRTGCACYSNGYSNGDRGAANAGSDRDSDARANCHRDRAGANPHSNCGRPLGFMPSGGIIAGA